jgi:hypothetical protein
MTNFVSAVLGAPGAAVPSDGAHWASGGGSEICPLPFFPVPALGKLGLARGTRSRTAARRAAALSANQTIQAPNWLSGVNPKAICATNSARSEVAERILCLCLSDVPPKDVELPQAALLTLLGSKASPYMAEDPCRTVAFDESLLSLPERGARCELTSVLEGAILLISKVSKPVCFCRRVSSQHVERRNADYVHIGTRSSKRTWTAMRDLSNLCVPVT